MKLSAALDAMIPDITQAVTSYLGQFPDEAGALSLLAQQLAVDKGLVLLRSNMLAHITTSSLVLNREATKALLIRHRLYDKWLQPGGHFELPGNLWESAAREVEEETGVAATLHPWCAQRDLPLDIDTHDIPEQPRKSEGPHLHHDFVFLSVADEGELTPQLEEVHGAAWMPLSELRKLNTVRMNRMLDKLQVVLDKTIA